MVPRCGRGHVDDARCGAWHAADATLQARKAVCRWQVINTPPPPRRHASTPTLASRSLLIVMPAVARAHVPGGQGRRHALQQQQQRVAAVAATVQGEQRALLPLDGASTAAAVAHMKMAMHASGPSTLRRPCSTQLHAKPAARQRACCAPFSCHRSAIISPNSMQ